MPKYDDPAPQALDISDDANWWTRLFREFNSGRYFNVKNPDFGSGGAAGNGVADDTAEIQACIDASAVGDTIIFPPGTYLISSPLVLKPFRRYEGLGPIWADTTVIKVANGSSANFQSTSGHSGLLVSESWNTNQTTSLGPVHIANLSLDGNKANNATGQHSGVILYAEYWSTYENLRCYNCKKKGVLMTRTAKNNVAQISGISDIEFVNLHCAANDEDGVCQLSSGAGNNTDVVFSGRTLLYDNGGSAMIADNPGGWKLNDVHFWNNGEHGVYMDTGSHAVKINGLYGENFGVDAAASTQYFGLRLRTFDVTPSTNTVPPQIENVTIQTTDPAGTSSFYCVSIVGDGAEAHAYLSNVHVLGANTARGHGIELYSNTGSFVVHESGVEATGFVSGQDRELLGSGLHGTPGSAFTNVTGTSYTLVRRDAERTVECSNAGTTTVTVPANTFTAGRYIEITRMSGAVNIVAGAGMTLRAPGGLLSLASQYSTAGIRFRSATEAVVAGDLA